jgi:methyl-accepting chemotaxis protein
LLIGTGLLTAVIMSLVSYLGNSQMAAAVNDNEVSMTALRNHLEADMMHDALRADVLSALAGKLSQSVDRFRL